MTGPGPKTRRGLGLWGLILLLAAALVLVTTVFPPERTAPPGTGNPGYQAPHLQWLRVLTYSGSRLDIQWVEEQAGRQDDPAGFAGLLGPTPGEEEPQDPDEDLGASGDPFGMDDHRPPRWAHPPPTAVVDRGYRANLDRLLPREMRAGEETQGRWELRSGPPGMEISAETGRIEWVPADESLRGVHQVEAVHQLPGSLEVLIRYRLSVSGRFHPLGTNARGEDVLRMLVSSARWMIFPGLLGILVAVGLGSLMGALAGFYDVGVGRASRTTLEVIESIPGLLLILVVSVATNFNLVWIMVGVGVALLPAVAAEVTTTVRGFRKRAFVESSRELGLTDSQILWREILWLNTRPILARFVWYGLGFVVLMEVTLSYLGMGVQPVNYSWGTMLIEGRERLNYGEYWQLLFPAVTVVAVLATCQLLGRRAALAVQTGEEEGR